MNKEESENIRNLLFPIYVHFDNVQKYNDLKNTCGCANKPECSCDEKFYRKSLIKSSEEICRDNLPKLKNLLINLEKKIDL